MPIDGGSGPVCELGAKLRRHLRAGHGFVGGQRASVPQRRTVDDPPRKGTPRPRGAACLNREGSASQLGDNAGDAAGPRISGLRAEHRGDVGLPGAGRQLLPRGRAAGDPSSADRRSSGTSTVRGAVSRMSSTSMVSPPEMPGSPAPFGEKGSRNLPPITATVERYSNPLTLTTTAGRLPAASAVTTSSAPRCRCCCPSGAKWSENFIGPFFTVSRHLARELHA